MGVRPGIRWGRASGSGAGAGVTLCHVSARRAVGRALRLSVLLLLLAQACAAAPDQVPAGAGTSAPLLRAAQASETPLTPRQGLGRADPGLGRMPVTATPSAAPVPAQRVGALFDKDLSKGHFCTASVVGSPHHNLIITAAHCLQEGSAGSHPAGLLFVPGYRQGRNPQDSWQVKDIVVDPRWTDDADPDLDVAFIVLQPRAGRNVGELLGEDHLAINQPATLAVKVTGYRADSPDPITCAGEATAQGATQRRFACPGYADGTSGAPWLTGVDPVTHLGQLVGVIGGYQQGGDTADVSYSPYFGDAVERLYRQAVTRS